MQDYQPQDIQDDFEFSTGNVWKKKEFHQITPVQTAILLHLISKRLLFIGPIYKLFAMGHILLYTVSKAAFTTLPMIVFTDAF